MANTLTGLLPILYSALQTVAAEKVGLIDVVTQDFDAKESGLNQTVRVPISPTQSVGTYTPAQVVTVGSDRAMTYADVVITKQQMSTFNLLAEEERALMSGGNTIATETFRQSVMQAMRAIRNAVELDLASTYKQASNAYGTAGTTPFASNLNILGTIKQTLDDEGCPDDGDRFLVYNSLANTNLYNLGVLQNFYQQGSSNTLINGVIPNLNGMKMLQSAQIKSVAAGTGTSYVVNNVAGYAVGATTIASDIGSGTMLAGDVIAFQADSVNKYVVGTALAAGSLAINRLGLKVAAADEDTITISAAHVSNLYGHKRAIALVTRPPAMQATPLLETQLIQDPVSKLTFLMVRAVGDGLTTYRLHLNWGWQCVQSEFLKVLMG